MARMARVVVPHFPHHVTQRGSRRERTFFGDDDFATYSSLLAKASAQAGVEIWAYCLMPNHVHLVAIPRRAEGLANLFQMTHWRYACAINRREGWRGHLWQERFHSFPMDEPHLLMAVRYIELNPVRAGLCSHPEDWSWSSVHAHLRTVADPLVNAEPMLTRIGNWREYLDHPQGVAELDVIRRHGATGRPAGSCEFIDLLERVSGRRLRPLKRGRKAVVPRQSPSIG